VVDDPAGDLDALASAAAGGDRAALDRLLAAIRPACLQRCGRLLPNPLDAEEAAQEALLAVATRIGGFEGRSRFSTWLYTVTTNAALDTYRRLKRRTSVLGVELDERAAPGSTSVLAGTRIDLLDSLEQIDPRFAEPVVLRDVCDLDYAEIAELLGVPVGTVKSRIHEGRRSLEWLMNR
jgi:RNA polymerase sigma-70 factor (ECF subfamily)